MTCGRTRTWPRSRLLPRGAVLSGTTASTSTAKVICMTPVPETAVQTAPWTFPALTRPDVTRAAAASTTAG
eukprot:10051716-Alexandrium_andersonii.AAC.1